MSLSFSRTPTIELDSTTLQSHMRFFIAGVMQGSSHGHDVLDQDYREFLREKIASGFPDADIYDPWAEHRESIGYSDTEGKRVFLAHNKMCSEVDVVVAYVPQASMGTAIEMWEAYRNSRHVIAISPMKHNWVIKFVSDHRFSSLDEFASAVDDGSLRHLLESDRPE